MDFVAARMPRDQERTPPPGACDTHNHVYGPFDAYPLEHPPDYPVPLSPVETYLRMLEIAGLERGVLVQPTQQGCNVKPLLNALRVANGRLRGVAAVRPDVSDAALERMGEAGVVGLRFVDAPMPSGTPRPGSVGFDSISALAPRMGQLEWSVNVWGRLATLMDNLDTLLQPELPVVFEHMGMPDVAEGVDGRHFRNMLALLREGRIWVKLVVCRCSQQTPGYGDLRPFADALLLANADQLLWGSDWPYIAMLNREPDVTDLLDVLLDWVDDADLQGKILVENPARIFSFDQPLQGPKQQVTV